MALGAVSLDVLCRQNHKNQSNAQLERWKSLLRNYDSSQQQAYYDGLRGRNPSPGCGDSPSSATRVTPSGSWKLSTVFGSCKPRVVSSTAGNTTAVGQSRA